MYCKKCGAEIDDLAVICPKCGCSTGNTRVSADDAPSGGFAFLGFLIPILGLILYLVWKTEYPMKAHSVGKGALIGFITSLALSILMPIIGVSCVGCMATGTYY